MAVICQAYMATLDWQASDLCACANVMAGYASSGGRGGGTPVKRKFECRGGELKNVYRNVHKGLN